MRRLLRGDGARSGGGDGHVGNTKTGRAVVIHEAPRSFGCGAEVVARIQEHLFSELKAPVLRVASRDVTVPFSRVLEAEYLYQASAIEAAIRKTLEKRAAR